MFICNVSEQYGTVPMPMEDLYQFGIHPVVCCPGGFGGSKKPIFFPSDPQHEDYEVPSYEDYEGGDYNYNYQQPVQQQQAPKVRLQSH